MTGSRATISTAIGTPPRPSGVECSRDTNDRAVRPEPELAGLQPASGSEGVEQLLGALPEPETELSKHVGPPEESHERDVAGEPRGELDFRLYPAAEELDHPVVWVDHRGPVGGTFGLRDADVPRR